MTAEPLTRADTVLDRLIAHLRAKDQVLDGQDRPAVILWTDPREEWRPLIGLLQARLGELLVLGDYRPEARTGPAIWIRCVVDGALDEPVLPEDRPPIVYLPRVARQDLRAGEGCPEVLKPLVELIYRGTMWLQPNGSDWGVTTFLTSPKALGLDVARDRETAEALLRALPEVALAPLTQLAGHRLHGDDFDRMLAPDLPRDLLRWMCDAAGTRVRLGENGWAAFCKRSRDELGFDPATEAEVAAGERLGRGEGAWAAVWERFAEAPACYGEVAGRLRRSRPLGEIPFAPERWPDLNAEDEENLRRALGELPALRHPEACEEVARLEESHGRRRSWVWARMGLSPLAQVLEPLSRLASEAFTPIGGSTPEDLASAYRERGWQADAAAWEAIALAPSAHENLVAAAVRHLLAPWLEDSARAFQAAVARAPLPRRGEQAAVEAADDVCILFADGLRYDLGRRLAERLEGRGCRVEVGHRWAALPTVTATAKPAVTPVADAVVGDGLGETFGARLATVGRPADAGNLREMMAQRGYQLLGADLFDGPGSHPARGWAEAGRIDSLGHKLGVGLARHIGDQIDRLTEQIVALLEAGWTAVRVVSDHGWLLLPGGLPKVDLPKHLTESRWPRCAVVAGQSAPDVMRVPWHWNSSQWFATAPGIACFNRTEEYCHGGLSLQECLTPMLVVERGGEREIVAVIRSITWRGLRCFIEASVRGGSVRADLRLGRSGGGSVAAAPKTVEPDGTVSLVLGGDEHEGDPLVLVLVDDGGRVLAQQATQAGVSS